MTRTRSQAGAYSRQKGTRFELAVAKVLTAWLGVEVRRTPMSGAYGGEWSLGGDLMAQAPVPFHAELKNREGWRLEQLLSRTGGPVGAWLESTREAAAQDGKFPLVVFTRNRVPPVVAVPTVVAADLLDSSAILTIRYRDWVLFGLSDIHHLNAQRVLRMGREKAA